MSRRRLMSQLENNLPVGPSWQTITSSASYRRRVGDKARSDATFPFADAEPPGSDATAGEESCRFTVFP